MHVSNGAANFMQVAERVSKEAKFGNWQGSLWLFAKSLDHTFVTK